MFPYIHPKIFPAPSILSVHDAPGSKKRVLRLVETLLDPESVTTGGVVSPTGGAICEALQLIVDPPLLPPQLHVYGVPTAPLHIEDGVPVLQRFVGAAERLCPLEVPHEPFTGVLGLVRVIVLSVEVLAEKVLPERALIIFWVIILDIVFELKFAVYTFPAESTLIPRGLLPVVPSVVETPRGVILVTVFAP